MTYKGYEIRRDVQTKLLKGEEVVEVEAWGIYANGNYKGAVRTPEQAKDYIDTISKDALYRPRERTHIIQRTDYDSRGNAKTRTYRG